MSHPDMRTTSNLVARLKKKEADLMEQGELAPISSEKRDSMNQISFAERKKKMRCHNCGELGHLMRECAKPVKGHVKNWEKRDVRGYSNPSRANLANSDIDQAPTNSQWAAVVSKLSGWDGEWILDSGASSHMCNKRDWFCELMHFDQPVKCFIGDGNSMNIIGIGSIMVKGLVGGSRLLGELDNVMFVPELATNLFSVGAAAEKGLKTVFMGRGCKLLHGDRVVAEANKRDTDGLYLLKMEAVRTPLKALKVGHPRTLGGWHRALGHANTDRIKTLLKDLGQKWTDEEIAGSECPAGKGRRVSHPSIEVRADTPGCIHVDLSGGPNKTSLQGFHYYLLCNDESTDFTMVYSTKDKSSVPLEMANMIRDFEANSGHPVHTVCSDNGTEFVNETTRLLFLRNGFEHRTSAPHCPQQNGKIEREMYTITGSARTMLIASKLPVELWPEAVEIAVHVKNRLPNKLSHRSPYERLLNRKPKIDHLRKFGEQVHVIVNDKYLTKWDARTTPGFLVGYTEKSNTYRVYVPDKNRVVRSCDIIIKPHNLGTKEINIVKRENEVQIDCARYQKMTGANQDPASAQNNVKESTSVQIQERNSSGSEESWSFSTPNETMREVRWSKPLVTGPALDNFFNQYLETDNETEDQYSLLKENRPPTPPKRSSSKILSQKDQQHDKDESPPRPPRLSDKSHLIEREGVPEPAEHYPPPQLIPRPCEDKQNEERTASATEEPPNLLPHNIETHDRSSEQLNSIDRCTLCITQEAHNTNELANIDELPKTYKQAMNREDSSKWEEAIKVELDAHESNKTWIAVDIPEKIKRYSSKWVFTLKRDSAGNIERYKARLVARGFEQRHGLDFSDTYAPVAKIESIRTIFAISAARKYTIRQFDVSTAFLYGTLKEVVYIDPPEGVPVGGGQCLKLSKALYGLRQAPRTWNSTFNQALIDLGLYPLETDQCIYRDPCKEIFVVIYVDDGLVVGKNQAECTEVVDKLELQFKIKRMSCASFVGFEVSISDNMITLGQQRYIKDILEKFRMSNAKGASSPLQDVKDLCNIDEQPKATTATYRQAVGCIQYLGNRTRPDISFAANLLGRFNNDPQAKHWSAVKQLLRYLKQTADLKLVYRGSCDQITAYSDADWANDRKTRASTTGLLINMGSGPVIFVSRRQPDIAQASTEAEYIAACETVKELLWLAQFFDELGVSHNKPRLMIDNQSTITQIKNLDTPRRSKHVDV